MADPDTMVVYLNERDPIWPVVQQWCYDNWLQAQVNAIYMEAEVAGVKTRYHFTGQIGSTMSLGDWPIYETIWRRLPVE